MTLRRAIVILAVGTLGTFIASWNLSGSAWDALRLAAKAGGAAAAVGVLGIAALTIVRARPLATQTTVAIVTTVIAIAAGAFTAGESMFNSPSPYAALAVILISSGTVGLLTGLFLSHRVQQGSESLAAAARSIGRLEPTARVQEPPTEELAQVAEELERMSRRLEESRARASAIEDARRELVAWISHDLRTPLARIRAIVEALEDGVVADPEGVADYHGRLRAETDRLAQLIEGLFELSQISAGTLELERTPIQLGDLVSDLVAAFAPLARQREIELKASMTGPGSTIDASMEHLERALSNLVDNALRYSQPGGSVDVEVGTENGSATVAITDSCGGLSPEQVSRMFENQFARARARQTNNGGTGLGLAIAKGLIKAHEGEVTVEDAGSGSGCRFVVTLPIVKKSGS